MTSRQPEPKPVGGPKRASWLIWLAGTLIVVVGGSLCAARWFGYSRLPVIADVVAVRNALTLVGALSAVALAVLAVFWVRHRVQLGIIAASVALVTIVSGAGVFTLGLANDSPAVASDGDLRIVSWNINGDLVTAQQVAAVARANDANVVVLPDATLDVVSDLSALMPGFPVNPTPSPLQQTYILTSNTLGTFQSILPNGPTPEREAIVSDPDSQLLPRFVAIHATQPALRGNSQWNADLEWAESQCSTPNTVLVGDFNATIDNFGADRLGGCADTASARGVGSTGTWPTRLPAFIGMALDRVLATPNWHADSFTVLTDQDASGARHRPILAVLNYQ